MLKNKQFYDLGRRAWSQYGKYVPRAARGPILSAGKWLEIRLDNAAADTLHSEGNAAAVTHALTQAPAEETAEPAARNDGMSDYPATCPQMAFDYLAGLVRWLADSNYRAINYKDLAHPYQHGDEGREFQRWIELATAREEKTVLLQYDVDARPDVTAELLKVHIDCGVTASVMLFHKKMFDWKLRQEGIAEIDEAYRLDFATLDAFQRSGGVIGYHCNALERAGGNLDRAIELFHHDLAELRRHFDITLFSMHGGLVRPDGLCNATLPVQKYLPDLGLKWVHNGHSVYFHANWADGGISNPSYRNECSDPLDVLLSSGIGQRVRLLFHPQYYNDFSSTRFEFPHIEDQKWIRETRAKTQTGGFKGKVYWKERWDKATGSIATFNELFDAPADERPVFVHGMSRSGTTLLGSMFDAHPEGAMAYESYPHYLHTPSDGGVLTAEEYIYVYQTLMNYPDNVAFNLLDRPPLRNVRLFAAVTSWTGMTTQETGELLRAYLTKHHRVADALEALKIVAATARFKIRNQPGATFWGTKCQGNYEDYFVLWPNARLLYILRNGLDILASQMTNGAFNPDARTLGRNWRAQYERFAKFKAENPHLKPALVQYEHLVADPEATARAFCDEIGLSFHPQMIRQHEIETTLVKNPRGQLSVKRVQQPIDATSVNRWKSILSKSEVDAFLEGCGGPDLFEQFGLDWKL